jgi:hypothetical protein
MRKNPFSGMDKTVPVPEETRVEVIPDKGLEPGVHNVSLVPVPVGCKAIIVKQEFSPEITTQIDLCIHELKKITSVQTAEEAAELNAVLNKANKIVKNVGAERLGMTRVLDDVKSEIMSEEKRRLASIQAVIQVQTLLVTQFQQREAARIKAENDKIQKERDEKMRKEQEEINREATIKNWFLSLDKTIQIALIDSEIDNVDSLISEVSLIPIPDCINIKTAKAAIAVGMEQLKARKEQLEKIAQASAANAASLQAIQDKQNAAAKAKIEAIAIQEETIEMESTEALQSAALNIQMDAELKTAQLGKQKGVQKVWVFEEETIDLSLLPLEFHTFDKAKIKAAIASGRTEIPGVTIKQDIRNVAK